MQIFVGGAGLLSAPGSFRDPSIGHKVIRNYGSPGNAGRVGALGAEPIALIQPPARVWRRAGGSS
jgi:hypothetical protein